MGKTVLVAGAEPPSKAAHGLFEIFAEMDKLWKAGLFLLGVFSMGVGAKWYFATNDNLEQTGGRLVKNIETTKTEFGTTSELLRSELKKSECRLLIEIQLLELATQHRNEQSEQQVRLQEKNRLVRLKTENPAAFNAGYGPEHINDLSLQLNQKAGELTNLKVRLDGTEDRKRLKHCDKN